ncbi:MAG: bifunctional aspartate kinase/diaminopimelate decarboxylase [Deltaproteobacteria bacterium]|nr:bifunctional aspartate kinase/diaminopimelate decarboxylase [Deltaproteobacteria bacterium]
MKFGGTSVATPERWRTILEQAGKRVEAGLRPVIVCSALTKVTDLLHQLVEEALAGRQQPALDELRRRHAELATKLGVDLAAAVGEELAELERLATGISLVKEQSPRLVARVLAMGELLSTRLGTAFLSASGLPTAWVDARSCLTSADDALRPESQRVLNAAVDDDKDVALQQRFDELFTSHRAVITQGFIARDKDGATVLLGRGGSDTSASIFAARLQAARCEIWTDVPGIFTADPRVLPSAILVKMASFGEAQEIASMGAKVLHPRSIAPCRRHRIPIELRWTDRPEMEGTVIVGGERAGEGQVKAVCHKRGLTLISMDTPGMWQVVGFLADVFTCFKQRGLSVDLVSTSEMNVTVSLDGSANTLDARTLDALVQDLSKYCRARVIPGCAAVSLVGRRIRALLHQLGPVLSVFEEQKIHLVSQAASDLNLTFVVDEEQAERLVRSLHALLFTNRRLPEQTFGPSWRELFEDGQAPASRTAHVPPWWRARREELLAVAKAGTPVYVYDQGTLDEAIAALKSLTAVDRVLYAVKANPHAELLRRVERAGLGFECVSLGELDAVAAACPGLDPTRVLYTPNFAPRAELAVAVERGVRVTVDSLFMLDRWDELWRGRDIFLRIDTGVGRGHHDFVKTGGQQSKFGIGLADVEQARALADKAGTRVIGLHAHAGSGILEPHNWSEAALTLASLRERFPDVRVLDLGGGLGVPERPGQSPLALEELDSLLTKVKNANAPVQLWLEPGRFVVARAGALLLRVTQVKSKGGITFVGVDGGMNTLLRPALYGAYHEIVNLSRLDDKPSQTATVVGPICESGDVLGHARRLATAREGDVLLVGTAGAYGAAMASRYNLRGLPAERLLA